MCLLTTFVLSKWCKQCVCLCVSLLANDIVSSDNISADMDFNDLPTNSDPHAAQYSGSTGPKVCAANVCKDGILFLVIDPSDGCDG